MRGLLIANPNATTTDATTRDVLVSAIRSVVTLEAVTTSHRGHAAELAARAAVDGTELVVVLGGDGTVHEVVNGLLDAAVPGRPLPALATIPGGSANVFARATGVPNNPVEATGAILSAVRMRRFALIGLGRANGRWFTCNAGIGLDADVIAAMERQRSAGKRATPARYVATAVGQYFAHTDRRSAALTLLPGASAPVGAVFLAIVQNCSPWTYMGSVPVNACPDASFETGLDVFGARSMGLATSLRVTTRILRSAPAPKRGASLFLAHDLSGLTIVAGREMALQIDGEALGTTRHVVFESRPAALRIVDPTGTG